MDKSIDDNDDDNSPDKMEVENDDSSSDVEKTNAPSINQDENKNNDMFDPKSNDIFDPKSNDFFEDFRIRETLSKNFTKVQGERFSQYVNPFIEPSKIKEIAANVLPGVSIGKACKRILSSVAKTYAGELVEEAKKIMAERGDKGAVTPVHLREAYRRFNNQGKTYKSSENEKFFG